MTMKLNELPDDLKASLEAGKPHVPVGDPPRFGHESPLTPYEPPPDALDVPSKDGSKLPPITGDVKLEMSADGMVETGKPPPPITGGMAATEKPDMVVRRPPPKPG